jgi:hypothetical protein
VSNADEKETTMLRANVSRAQIKALRQIALEKDTTMQQIIGDLIADYLASNGHPQVLA